MPLVTIEGIRLSLLGPALRSLAKERKETSVQGLHGAIVVIVERTQFRKLLLRQRQRLLEDKPPHTLTRRRGREGPVIGKRGRIRGDQFSQVDLLPEVDLVITCMTWEMPEEGLQGRIGSSLLKEDANHKEVSILVLMDKMDLQGKWLPVEGVLTVAMEMKLGQAILPAVILHLALVVDDLLDRVAVVDLVHGVRLVGDAQGKTGGRNGTVDTEIDRGLAPAAAAKMIGRGKLGPMTRPRLAVVAPLDMGMLVLGLTCSDRKEWNQKKRGKESFFHE